MNRKSRYSRVVAHLGLLAVSQLALVSLPMLATSASAQSAPTTDPTTLMRQAAASEATGQWQEAAQIYGKAADAYQATGQSAERAQALKKSATMYEKYANALLSGAKAPAASAARQDANPPAAAPAAEAAAVEAPAPVAATAPAGAPPVSLGSSAIVHHNAVSGPNGKPIDGVKLSKHDTNIQSPSICVAPNGTIHVAFFEQQARGTECDIYHRSSSDGGKTWSDAKNLSEVMPGLNVGMCRIAADAAGRVYVIWNVGSAQYNPAGMTPHAGGGYNNLVYRVLSGGQWNGKAIPIHQMATNTNQQIGSDSYIVSTDPAGTVHVIWNEIPDRLHPEVLFQPGQHSSGVGDGLVMEATLNGTTPTSPQQIYMTTVSQGQLGPVMDNLDMLNGYVDAAGQAHIVAEVRAVRGGESNHFKIIENGSQTPGVDLPGTSDYWIDSPTLLLDAQGKQHIITMYQAGEQPNVRDYTVGSDNEPKVIRSVKGNAGKLLGFQAFQGPAGRMVAIMHINDTGKKTDEELYVSMSSGGAWSAPINVTNNTGRISFHSTDTSARSNVSTMSWGYPGPSAAAFDKSGHLLLIYVRNKIDIFGVSAVGVELAGGSTATPNLMFLRF